MSGAKTLETMIVGYCWKLKLLKCRGIFKRGGDGPWEEKKNLCIK